MQKTLGMGRILFGLGAALVSTTTHATSPEVIEEMPAELETRYALSAMPPALRTDASVYLLDPKAGYRLARKGSSGVECLVQRTAWELADFRDDIYIPLCYDAAGAATYLEVIKETAKLRAQGLGSTSLKAKIQRGFLRGVYRVPGKGGVSYMLSPVFRTVGPPDLKVRTMVMPHLMFYAPNLTNADIGAKPDLAVPATLLMPFIDRQGIGEQSYVIQLLGKSETSEILKNEKDLIEALCAYRKVLCVTKEGRSHH